jgi:hypothetical protein
MENVNVNLNEKLNEKDDYILNSYHSTFNSHDTVENTYLSVDGAKCYFDNLVDAILENEKINGGMENICRFKIVNGKSKLVSVYKKRFGGC